jgi:hypothetical protein
MSLEQTDHLFKGKSFLAIPVVDMDKFYNRPVPIMLSLPSKVYFLFQEDYTGTATEERDFKSFQYTFVWKVEKGSLSITHPEGHAMNFFIDQTPSLLSLTPELPSEIEAIFRYELKEQAI